MGLCPVCSQKHTCTRYPADRPAFTMPASLLNDCETFMGYTIPTRKSVVAKVNACARCLDWTHATKFCPRDWICRKDGCRQEHSKYLHEDSEPQYAVADVIELTSGAVSSFIPAPDPEQFPDPPPIVLRPPKDPPMLEVQQLACQDTRQHHVGPGFNDVSGN